MNLLARARAAHRDCPRCPHPMLLRWGHFARWEQAAIIAMAVLTFVVRPRVTIGSVTFALDLLEAPQHWQWWAGQPLFWGGVLAILAVVHRRNHRRRPGPPDEPVPDVPEQPLHFDDVMARFASHPAPAEPAPNAGSRCTAGPDEH